MREGANEGVRSGETGGTAGLNRGMDACREKNSPSNSLPERVRGAWRETWLRGRIC